MFCCRSSAVAVEENDFYAPRLLSESFAPPAKDIADRPTSEICVDSTQTKYTASDVVHVRGTRRDLNLRVRRAAEMDANPDGRIDGKELSLEKCMKLVKEKFSGRRIASITVTELEYVAASLAVVTPVDVTGTRKQALIVSLGKALAHQSNEAKQQRIIRRKQSMRMKVGPPSPGKKKRRRKKKAKRAAEPSEQPES